MSLLIGIIASAIILFQTQYIASGFMWALIHVAGPASFFAFWPTLISLATLWGGWTLLKYRAHKYRTLFSLGFSIVVIIAVEILMPITPLKAYLQQQAIDSVRAQNISDEVLLSANGNPTGIRLIYDVTFPRDGIYSISPSQYAPLDGKNELYPLQFGSFLNTTVQPEPSIPEAGQRFFKAKIPYHFVFDSAPNFLRFDESSKPYCIHLQPNTNYTDADVKTSINNAGNVKYKTFIQIDGPTSFTNRVVTKEYVTQHSYSVKEIYDRAVNQGVQFCQF